MPKRNMIADEDGRIQIEAEDQQEPPRKRFRDENGVDDYDSQPEDAEGSTFGYTPRNKGRTRDLQYYDVTVPEDKAIVIMVEDVLFRVDREELGRFCPGLAKILKSKKQIHETPFTEDSPLVFTKGRSKEWRAMIWALNASLTELKTIRDVQDLSRMICLAAISRQYEAEVFEHDAMSALYEACLPEHSDTYTGTPSILNSCSLNTLVRLYEVVNLALGLSPSSVSSTDPLINPCPAPKIIKQTKSETLGQFKHPLFYKNLPIMILRHWIAKLMPEAKRFNAVLQEPTQPEPSDTAEYPLIPDSTPILVTNYIPNYNPLSGNALPNAGIFVQSLRLACKYGIDEIHAAACYALLRTRELPSPTSSIRPFAVYTSKNASEALMNGASAVSREETIRKLTAPAEFTYYDSSLRLEDRIRLLHGEQSLQRVWEKIKDFGADLMPVPGSAGKTKTGTPNGVGAKASPKGKKGGKPRNRFRAPDGSLDSLDPMDCDEDEYDYYDMSAEPSVPFAPGAFPNGSTASPSETTEKPYPFGSGAARAFTFKAKGREDEDTGSTNRTPLSSRTSAYTAPLNTSPSPSRTPTRQTQSTPTNSPFKFNFADPHAPHAPDSDAHQQCKRTWGHAFMLAAFSATGAYYPASGPGSSSGSGPTTPDPNKIPLFDVLALLVRVEEKLLEDRMFRESQDGFSVNPECRKGALEMVRKVREGVWKSLREHFPVPRPMV